ncbi:MAG: hypothetical protein RLZZ26_335, partial [Candidatus Parcubacteria bacterium]
VASYALKALEWVAEKLDWFNKWVLQPMAVILSGHMLQQMTANIIGNVTLGGKNGTGQPQFIQDLKKQQQQVSTNQGTVFFTQLYKNMNGSSPYTNALVSSLRAKFLQNTSSAGFFAANKDTLNKTTGSLQNTQAFLNGNWSKGGAAAWFGLTTQNENNPYALSQAAQQNLASMVGEAQTTAQKVADWGKGFLSFCGQDTHQRNSAPATPTPGGDCTVSADCGDPGLDCDTTTYKCVLDELQPVVVTAHAQPGGTAVGDPCTNADGTAGVIKTPASVITGALDNALAIPADKLKNLGGGTVSTEIVSALKNVQDILTTVNLAQELLGSAQNDHGLVGSGAAVQTAASADGYMGVTADQIQAAAPNLNNASAAVAATGATSRAPQYESAWGIIRSSADVASSALTDLANACPAQATAAQTAMTSEVQPVLDQADAADAKSAAAEALIQQLKNENPDSLNTSGMTSAAIAAAASQYQADANTLSNMPPSDADVSSAQAQTQTTPPPDGATSTPPGSLNVSGGTIIDQMALVSTNAAALQAACH